jgi:hypothetical protein
MTTTTMMTMTAQTAQWQPQLAPPVLPLPVVLLAPADPHSRPPARKLQRSKTRCA